jgi:uncharacterized lipoprotein YddW (UPF0748 family)
MRDRSPGIGPRPALLAAAAIILLVVISRLHAQTDPDEVRAIWIRVDPRSPGLSAPDQARYDRQLAAEPLIYDEAFPERWRVFRAEQLTTLVARIRETIRAVRPAAVVSATVLPDPDPASTTWFQDWRSWLGGSLIDVVSPIASAADPAAFATEVASVRQITGRPPVWAGIGASRLSPTDIVASVRAARRLGAGGVILFSYDSLTGPSRGTEYLAQLGRAAFMQ